MAVRAAAGAICSPGGRGSRSPESRRGVHSTPRFAAGADVREVVLYNVLRAAPGNHECAGGTVLREVELARADKAQHKALQVRPALVREKRGRAARPRAARGRAAHPTLHWVCSKEHAEHPPRKRHRVVGGPPGRHLGRSAQLQKARGVRGEGRVVTAAQPRRSCSPRTAEKTTEPRAGRWPCRRPRPER